MRAYLKIGLFFLHKKITIVGKENIPKDGPILFIANHQNALIDAILIPTTTKREIHFLTRASAFTTNLISKFLKSLNMIPVYRIRDGFNTIEKNVSVFEQCFDILKNEGAVEIFAEGAHHLKRQIMPLKKGFARIILGTLQKYPHLNIQIVPIGINYDSHLNFPSSVSIHYGQPILANNFVNTENPDLRFTAIINEVTIALKNLTLHIKDDANYDETISKLNSANVDFTNPIEAAELLQNINSISETKPTKSSVNWFFPIHLITKLNSILPLLIWLYLKSKISDIVFTNTYRFALILTVFPLFYIIQTLIIYYFYNSYYALIYLGISILLGIISTKTMSINKE